MRTITRFVWLCIGSALFTAPIAIYADHHKPQPSEPVAGVVLHHHQGTRAIPTMVGTMYSYLQVPFYALDVRHCQPDGNCDITTIDVARADYDRFVDNESVIYKDGHVSKVP